MPPAYQYSVNWGIRGDVTVLISAHSMMQVFSVEMFIPMGPYDSCSRFAIRTACHSVL